VITCLIGLRESVMSLFWKWPSWLETWCASPHRDFCGFAQLWPNCGRVSCHPAPTPWKALLLWAAEDLKAGRFNSGIIRALRGMCAPIIRQLDPGCQQGRCSLTVLPTVQSHGGRMTLIAVRTRIRHAHRVLRLQRKDCSEVLR